MSGLRFGVSPHSMSAAGDGAHNTAHPLACASKVAASTHRTASVTVDEVIMRRTMLSAKIHRATVTHADLNYVGSVTIDAQLLRAADILPGERVSIVDVTNGARLETYVIEGERGSGVVGINGAAAHLVSIGDVVIVIAYKTMTDAEARTFTPRIVHVDAANRSVQIGTDPAHAVTDGLAAPPFAVRQ